jgi:hypothetical protein
MVNFASRCSLRGLALYFDSSALPQFRGQFWKKMAPAAAH